MQEIQPPIGAMARRIVQCTQPLQLILFGSHARGSPRSRSDVDLLIVVADGQDRRRVRDVVHAALREFRVSHDLVVTTPSEIERRGQLVGTVLRPALREGRVIYDAARGFVDEETSALGCWEVASVSQSDRVDETRTWLSDARTDLDIASEMTVARDPLRAGRACFFAQQAAEKALKAVLIFLQIQYPFTHDLDEIRETIPPDWPLREEFSELVWLSAWAIRGRYVGTWEQATPEDAAEAVQQASAIYDAVLRDLGRQGFEIGG